VDRINWGVNSTMNSYVKEVFVALTQKELKVRYKHHALGYIWSIANPLAFALIYFSVFKLIMKVKVDDFPIFLLSGLFPWQWIANSIGVGPMTFIGNAGLIKKIKFPRNLLSSVVVFQDMIHFLISIPVLICMFYFYNGTTPGVNWLIGVPLLCVAQYLVTYSLNLLIATLNLFFRDVEKLVQMSLTFLFFMTPVVYKFEMVPGKYKTLLLLNPFTSLIISWREVFMNNSLDAFHIGISFIWGVGLLLVSKRVYAICSWRFAEVI
jgi:lipopolysaccharide transport system permease protein